jgi:2-succinyl-6-hydroxy-2,4-cyclohexadiene-1-carboxylate synthase
MMKMKTYRISMNGHTWYVEVHGRGKPLLCLHGFTGSSQTWSELARDLEGKCQVILVDFLGHGQSSAPPHAHDYTMNATVDALFHVMDELGHATFACLGYSMGGRVALSMAAANPLRFAGLILESTSPGLKTESERIRRIENDERLAERIMRIGVEAFVQEWEKIPLFQSQQSLPEEALARQQRIRLNQRAIGLANSLRGLGTGAQPPVWEALSRISVPTLILTGEHDEKFCAIANEMHAKLPHAVHVMIPGAGHTVHLEQPKAYLEEVEQFLHRINWI